MALFGAKFKARSKAARRRARGRPRLPGSGSDREPNGKPSRRLNAVADRVMDVVINRRIRQQGIIGSSDEPLVKQAADPRRGYVLGMLLLGDRISEEQHDAGIRYGADMSRYYRLSGVAFPSVRAQDLFAVRGQSGESGESVERVLAAQTARRRMQALRDALLATGDLHTGRRVEYVVRLVCLLDLPDSDWGARSFRSEFLVCGLDALSRYYNGDPP